MVVKLTQKQADYLETFKENERAIQRIIDSLTEEEITEAMSDKYAYLDED